MPTSARWAVANSPEITVKPVQSAGPMWASAPTIGGVASRALPHIRKALDCFCEIFDGPVGVAVFDAVADTVLDVALQHSRAARTLRR